MQYFMLISNCCSKGVRLNCSFMKYLIDIRQSILFAVDYTPPKNQSSFQLNSNYSLSMKRLQIAGCWGARFAAWCAPHDGTFRHVNLYNHLMQNVKLCSSPPIAVLDPNSHLTTSNLLYFCIFLQKVRRKIFKATIKSRPNDIDFSNESCCAVMHRRQRYS